MHVRLQRRKQRQGVVAAFLCGDALGTAVCLPEPQFPALASGRDCTAAVRILQPLSDLRYIKHMSQAWAHSDGSIASHCTGLQGLPVSAPHFTGERTDPLLLAAL